jgi:putative peptide zinc metalloprotease protein
MDFSFNDCRLEPRKQVRIRLRADLIIVPQTFEGRRLYVIKDPVSLSYFRFRAREHFLLGLMDGKNTLEDIQKTFESNFRPDRLSLEEVEVFAHHLVSEDLAYHDSPQTGRHIFEQRQQRDRQQRYQAFINFLCYPIPICDPDRWLSRLFPFLSWMYTPAFFTISFSLIMFAFFLVGVHFKEFRNQFPSAQEFFSFQNAMYLGLAWGGVKVIHEVAHGLTCKAYGGEVHEMGVLLFFLCPSFYCDVTDTWAEPNKWKRMAVGFAGIYAEWIIAALAIACWWNTLGGTFLHQLSLDLVIICGISTLLFNLNPLLRFDGYHILADWLELPNLRTYSDNLLQNLIFQVCLGIENFAPRQISPPRQFWLVLYSAVSFLYRWLVTAGILTSLYFFLKSLQMDAIGALMAVGIACILISRSLYQACRKIYQYGRESKVKTGRMIVTTAVLTALLVLSFLPLPISPIVRTGLIQLEPEANEKVFVPYSATLERSYVHDGLHIEKGQLLAVYRSLDLENQHSDAVCQSDLCQIQMSLCQSQLNRVIDAREQARLLVWLSSATAERLRFAHKAELYGQNIKRLELRAPRSGVVLEPPSIDDIGRLWAKDQEQPFCTIADSRCLQALVPVSPADYYLLQEDLRLESAIRVTIRVPGADGHTWTARLDSLPQSEAKEVPAQLTTRCGGPLVVKPTSRSNLLVPQTQQYLLVVKFLETDSFIYAGGLAQVKIHCQPRSVAWWLWRGVNSTFRP